MCSITESSKNHVVFDSGLLFEATSGRVLSQSSGCDALASSIGEESIEVDYVEAIPQLQLSMTNLCTMACRYCAFRGRAATPGKHSNMPLDTAKRAIAFFVENFGRQAGYSRIDFGCAGEALLHRSVHPILQDYIRNYFRGTGVHAVWAGPNVTNGTLAIDSEVLGVLGPPQDISCDGPKDVHDDMRMYADGRGTYDDVESVIRTVVARTPDIGLSAVLTAKHREFDKIFLHLHETLGSRNIYMKPVNVAPNVSYGLNLNTLSKFQQGYDDLVSMILAQPRDRILRYLIALNPEDFFMRLVYRLKDQARQVYRCGAGKSGVYVDSDGSLFPCAHFIGKTGWECGDIYNGFDLSMRQAFAQLHVDRREPCKQCWARYLCGGGCYYQAVLANGDIDRPDQAKCKLVRHLCGLAVSLIGTLSEEHPDVLAALPAPFYLRKDDVNRDPEDPYRPSAQLKATQETHDIELCRPGALERTVFVTETSMRMRMTQDQHGLEISLFWHPSLHFDRIRLWFIRLKKQSFLMRDLLASSPYIKGKLYMIDMDGNAWQLVPPGDAPIRRVPYEDPVWKDTEDISVTMQRQTLQVRFGRTEIFDNELLCESYGFNLFIDLSDGGCCSLVRREPFCLVSPADIGCLAPYGGEFGTSQNPGCELNGTPVVGMEAIGRWTKMHANVC